MSEIDQQLSLAGHVVGAFQQIDFVERLFAAGLLMRAQEVIVSDPKRYTVTGTIFRVITAGDAVGFFKRVVQSFDELLERTELFGYLIIIGQADDLSDEDIPVFLQLALLCGQGIGAVAIGNELQGLAWEFPEFIKSHAYSKDCCGQAFL